MNKLAEFSEQELGAIADFIDSMRHKKQLAEKKIIKILAVGRKEGNKLFIGGKVVEL